MRAKIRRLIEDTDAPLAANDLCLRCQLRKKQPGRIHCSSRCAKKDLADRQAKNRAGRGNP